MVFLYIFFFVIILKYVWKFGYLVSFARTNFREFVLAKNFAGINFCEIAQNSRKLLLLTYFITRIRGNNCLSNVSKVLSLAAT